MRVVAWLCIAHASALGRKKTNGPSVKVSATLAVDKKVVGKADALFKKRTAQSCDAAAKIYEAELERTGYADAEQSRRKSMDDETVAAGHRGSVDVDDGSNVKPGTTEVIQIGAAAQRDSSRRKRRRRRAFADSRAAFGDPLKR